MIGLEPMPGAEDLRPSGGEGFRWVGAGRTALYLAALPVDASASEMRDVVLPAPHLDTATRALREGCIELAPTDRRALEAYFEAGGADGRLLVGSRSLRRGLGEDGGAGQRTGLCAVRDLDDVGCVVVPRLPSSRVSELERLAETAPRVLFLVAIESAGGGESGPLAPPDRRSDRLLVFRGEAAAERAAGLAARLELEEPTSMRRSGGVSPRRRGVPGRRGAGRTGVDIAVPESCLESLRHWRLWSGLERAIDEGSRWIVFEPDHSLVRRRLEREVRAFLHDLEVEGVLPSGSMRGIRVRCVTAADTSDARVRLEVRLPRLEELGSWTRSPPTAGGDPTSPGGEHDRE